MSFVPMDQLLRAIIDHLVNHVCERRGGKLALNRWQLFCLRMWWSDSRGPREPALEQLDALAPDDARRLFEHCLRMFRYTYHPEIDSFTLGDQVPVPWAPPAPSPLIAPGSGILYHVARTRRPYRTRLVHVDLRTQNAVDDVPRGIGDVMHCCTEDPRSASSDIIALSAPVPGLLDGLPLDTFEEMIRTGGSKHAPPVSDPGAPARVHIRFDRDPGEALLRALVTSAPPAPDAGSAAAGILLATLRQRAKDLIISNYVWMHRLGDVAPLQVARAIIRERQLGSLFEHYRTDMHEQIDQWLTSQEEHHDGEPGASGAPGMADFDINLHRVAIRVRAGREAYCLIRAGFAEPLSRRMVETVRDVQSRLEPDLGALIGSLRRWFRGTVARAHLGWDLERSLLIRIADHLAGTSRFMIAEEFQKPVALLHSMLADVEVDERDAECTPAEVIERGRLGEILHEMHGVLAGAIVVGPWLSRRGYRVADTRPDSEGKAIPQPAIYVAGHPYKKFCLASECDDRRGEDTRGLSRVASSRDYLVALQSVLSSLLVSRPNITLLRWRGDSTVDLLDEHGPVETVTLDLPAGERRLGWIEIVQDSPERAITLHHDHGRPFYHRDPSSGSPIPRSNPPLRDVLERRQELMAGSALHAIAVVWHQTQLAIPLSIALPRAGEPLRKRLNPIRDLSPEHPVTDVPHLNASFSFTYAPTILRYGRYKKEYQEDEEDEAKADFHTHDVSDADEPFSAQYLYSLFQPSSRVFPSGLKPFGRQLHVFPVTVKNAEPQLLSIITSWEQTRGELYAQRAHLQAHIESVVKQHGGSVVAGHGSVEYVKYVNDRTSHGPTRELVDPREYSVDREADNYDVVVMQSAASEPAEFSTNGIKREKPLTDGLLRVLLKFVMSPDGTSFRDDAQERQFRTLRAALEPDRKKPKNGQAVDWQYWNARPAPDTSGKVHRFRASYLIVVPPETGPDR